MLFAAILLLLNSAFGSKVTPRELAFSGVVAELVRSSTCLLLHAFLVTRLLNIRTLGGVVSVGNVFLAHHIGLGLLRRGMSVGAKCGVFAQFAAQGFLDGLAVFIVVKLAGTGTVALIVLVAVNAAIGRALIRVNIFVMSVVGLGALSVRMVFLAIGMGAGVEFAGLLRRSGFVGMRRLLSRSVIRFTDGRKLLRKFANSVAILSPLGLIRSNGAVASSAQLNVEIRLSLILSNAILTVLRSVRLCSLVGESLVSRVRFGGVRCVVLVPRWNCRAVNVFL